MNYKIHVYDPVEEAVENTKQLFSNKIEYHNTPQECVNSSKLCVVINFNKQYKDLTNWSKDGYIIDCWRSITSNSNNIFYIGK
jgi:UDP-glucose 6-dehydrogenase